MPQKRLPDFLKRGIADTEKTKAVRTILKKHCLSTVCEEARCPNKAECYAKDTATFLIMGNVCTRNCTFCNITKGKAKPLEKGEPARVAQAVKALGLDYAVITSVTRDDLDDGGARHFAEVIKEIKKLTPSVKVEVLTPDFKGDKNSIKTVMEAGPDVFNHNIETVEALYPIVRPMANYRQSLDFLAYIKEKKPKMAVKSGLMVGLGETKEQITKTLQDLKSVKCDIVTLGQYIAPSKKHLNVFRYYDESEYEELNDIARKIGIKYFNFTPLTRSSYKAGEIFSERTEK